MKKIFSLFIPVVMTAFLSVCRIVWNDMTPAPPPTATKIPAPTVSVTVTFTTTPSPVEITVAATKGWQNTGFTVQAKKPFGVEYIAGEWTGQYIGEGTKYFGPEGSEYTCNMDTCCEPLPGAPAGALIGKVGGETFLISLGGPFVVNTSGLLFVRMNDCDTGLYDNQGEVVIEIIP